MTFPTVLLVDDDRFVTEAWVDIFRRQPYQVLTAGSGTAALELLRARAVNVLVADENMPGMSGLDLLTAARELSPGTVAIMVTGSSSPETAIRAINEAGVFRFLRKPCDPRHLLAAVAEAAAAQTGVAYARDAQRRRAEEVELGARFERSLAAIWLATQPIGRASARSAFAYEVLVRTREPTVTNGGEFISLAERTGRVLELEREIRRRAADLAERLPAGACLFVNVHAESLRASELGSDDCPLTRFADRVVLEVTENASAEDILAASDRLAAWRERGFRLALDDLGAGSAGLGSLAALQPHFAKLDQALVRGVEGDRVRSRIIRGLLGLCRELDIELVAEGVETVAEYEHLLSIGSDFVQGYLVARPAEGFPDLRWPATDAS